MMKKVIATALVCLSVGAAATGSALADPLPGAEVNNPNANANACWGMDRSFYASEGYFADNMDIKQSFPKELGKIGEQRAAWVATYCDAHGPAS
jgi:hypothetical protein